MKASDIRKGTILLVEGAPCRVMDFQHRTPGNLRAFVQVRMRNLLSGNTFDTRFSSTDIVEEVRLDTKEFQVLYRDGDGVHVMDIQTYDQMLLTPEAVGDAIDWMTPDMVIQIEMMESKPVGVQLPSVVELEIVETTPVLRGATKTASTKPARLSNGVTVQVPEFVAQGEKIRVDPRSGSYLERAK